MPQPNCLDSRALGDSIPTRERQPKFLAAMPPYFIASIFITLINCIELLELLESLLRLTDEPSVVPKLVAIGCGCSLAAFAIGVLRMRMKRVARRKHFRIAYFVLLCSGCKFQSPWFTTWHLINTTHWYRYNLLYRCKIRVTQPALQRISYKMTVFIRGNALIRGWILRSDFYCACYNYF